MWRTSPRPAAHSSSGQGDVTDNRTPAIDCRKPPEIATITASAKSSRQRTSTTRAQRGTTGDLEMPRSSTVRDYIDGQFANALNGRYCRGLGRASVSLPRVFFAYFRVQSSIEH